MRSGIQLKDAFKAHTYELDKLISPQETIGLVRERLGKAGLDLLNRTVRIDTGRLDIPVYISLCGEEAVRTIGTKKQMGKGGTPEQAEASALMELVERYSFFWFIKHGRFAEDSYLSLKDQAIPFECIPLSVHDPDPANHKNRLCFEDLPLAWTWALDVTRKRDVMVPIHWFYLIHEYNGPAAGNSLEEAVVQGLCEVMERHVSSIISHEKQQTPGIDPESIRDPVGRELLGKFVRNGIEVYLKDFSLNTGIPTVGVLAFDPSTFPDSSEIIFTAGTATSPEKSVIRALTEIAQLAGEFQNKTTYRPTLPKFKRLEEAAYIAHEDHIVNLSSLPDVSDGNLYQEVQLCAAALGKIGLDVFVVDITHPKIGLPAVYTIVPGAHFRDRTRDNSVCYHAARLVGQIADENRAVAEMERMAGLFPDRYEVRFFLGYAYERKGVPQKALSHFRAALNMGPRRTDLASIHCHVAIGYRDQGLYEKAVESLEMGREHDCNLKEIYQQLGFCYFKLGAHMKAIEQFEKAIEIDPGSAIDYANIGANLKAMGHTQAAVPMYEMALELDPGLEFAREHLKELRCT
ncbi:MAG: YcaO-like family protein [Desulfobacterales bacterium]|nr:YcaO-like family protein [Desulfobacterales bacterium]